MVHYCAIYFCKESYKTTAKVDAFDFRKGKQLEKKWISPTHRYLCVS